MTWEVDMQPDVIFVLVAICAAVVIAMAVQSRRRYVVADRVPDEERELDVKAAE